MNSNMIIKFPCILLAFYVSALATGCTTVGPDHQIPVVETGQNWLSPKSDKSNPIALAHWWKTLGDPDLEKVMERALAHNLDLRQADLNIETARALLLRAEALSYPTGTANSSVQPRRVSINSPEYNPSSSPDQTVFDAGLDVSWEIDLFGSLRRQRESALASLQMSEAEAIGLRISIAAETARTYFTLRGAQRELKARQASVDSLQNIYKLVLERHLAGDLPVFEVEKAKSRLDQAKAELPSINARIEAAVIALGFLAGDLPESLLALSESEGIEIALRPIAVGQRADLLRRRPDIIAAERNLAAATAETGVAIAELFPKLTISANAGFRALSGGDLFESDSRKGSIGPIISWRIFDGGQVRAEILAAESRQKEAAVGYKKAVLSALSDAEKALSQYGHALQSIDAQVSAVENTRRVASITRHRYELGDMTLADALDAEREYTDQLALLVQFKTSGCSDLATLYKALGGGAVL